MLIIGGFLDLLAYKLGLGPIFTIIAIILGLLLLVYVVFKIVMRYIGWKKRVWEIPDLSDQERKDIELKVGGEVRALFLEILNGKDIGKIVDDISKDVDEFTAPVEKDVEEKFDEVGKGLSKFDM